MSSSGPRLPADSPCSSRARSRRRARCRRLRAASEETPRTLAASPGESSSQETSKSSSRSSAPSLAHRPQDLRRLAPRCGLGRELGTQGLGQAFPQPGPPPLGPMPVGDDPTCHPEEPQLRPRVVRHLVEAPPGDEESLGDDVGGVLRILDPPQRVGEDRPALIAVEPAEADPGELAAERPLLLDLTRDHLSLICPDRGRRCRRRDQITGDD